MGRLTADPEVRQTPNGVSVCAFSIAVDRYVNGEKKADFINCVAWRTNAENIARFFKKGSLIAVNGNIQTRTYQDKDTGKNRTAFEVLVERFHFTGSSQNNGNAGTSANGYSEPSAPSYQSQQQGFEPPRQSRFASPDIDDFATVSSDDGDLPF